MKFRDPTSAQSVPAVVDDGGSQVGPGSPHVGEALVHLDEALLDEVLRFAIVTHKCAREATLRRVLHPEQFVEPCGTTIVDTGWGG